MLIDTHCHLNMMVKNNFDTLLSEHLYDAIKTIIEQAAQEEVRVILNIGTSLIESTNSIAIAQKFPQVYAVIGIHPNDATEHWKKEFATCKEWVKNKEKNKIVGIGECGLDFHYPDYALERQKDVFKAHIELALEHQLPLVVHTRDAYDETLRVLEEYKNNHMRGTIHCFSEDLTFARQTIAWGFAIGIGGTVTYPKNNILREVVKNVGIKNIILETDAPFLPPQAIRGKQNHPRSIRLIAEYIAQLLNLSFTEVAEITTATAKNIFTL